MAAEAHAERAHAPLSPSAAARWSNCPGSVALESQCPAQPSSSAADEGTAAHELASQCLTHQIDPAWFLDRVIDVQTGKILPPEKNPTLRERQFLVTEEMVEAVQGYVGAVRKAAAAGEMQIEHRVQMPGISEDCWGTADAIVYQPETNELHVFDLKYGRGVVVEVEDNLQLVCYAHGAASHYRNRRVETVHAHIYQPRAAHSAGPHRTWTVSVDDLHEKIAALADAGVRVREGLQAIRALKWGEFSDQYLSPGDHCRWCSALAVCPARRDSALAAARLDFGVEAAEPPDPLQMSSADLGKLLRKAKQLETWLKAVREHANAEARAGRPPAGFKLVEGRRGDRKWVDSAAARAVLASMFDLNDEDMLTAPKPSELLSPAQLEKKIPPKMRDILETFVKQSAGNSELVVEGDPRPPLKVDAATEFTVA